jgi:hypothetical protein
LTVSGLKEELSRNTKIISTLKDEEKNLSSVVCGLKDELVSKSEDIASSRHENDELISTVSELKEEVFLFHFLYMCNTMIIFF